MNNFSASELQRNPLLSFYLEKVYSHIPEPSDIVLKDTKEYIAHNWKGAFGNDIESVAKTFLVFNALASNLASLENSVVDAYRDPHDRTIVRLDPTVRKKNQDLIKLVDAKIEDLQNYLSDISEARLKGFHNVRVFTVYELLDMIHITQAEINEIYR
ncbi:MAG: hypothetical protein K0S74_1296 [Chlamydiales bacterium]|jgi:hypothetical protein|nr:hypothetical protein [Chlamydiales bacterium]